MTLQKITVFGSDNIGVYVFTNNKYTLVPPGLERETKDVIEEVLRTDRKSVV